MVALLASLPENFKNEKVSRKTLKMMGFADVKEETNLSTFAELYHAWKNQAQKGFLISNIEQQNPQKKKRRKRKKSGSSSGSPTPAPAIQLALL